MSKIFLAYYNDGKERSGSHTVYLKPEEDMKYTKPYCDICNFLFSPGHGSNVEEAIDDYKETVRQQFEELKLLVEEFLATDNSSIPLKEVDCLGKPIK